MKHRPVPPAPHSGRRVAAAGRAEDQNRYRADRDHQRIHQRPSHIGLAPGVGEVLEQHCPGKPFLGDAVRRAAEGKIKHDIKGEQKNRDDKNQPRVGAGFSESFHPILLPTFLFLWISSTARKPR